MEQRIEGEQVRAFKLERHSKKNVDVYRLYIGRTTALENLIGDITGERVHIVTDTAWQRLSEFLKTYHVVWTGVFTFYESWNKDHLSYALTQAMNGNPEYIEKYDQLPLFTWVWDGI
jgi:hypothetical protein